MRIGFIGSGHIGSTVGRLAVDHGHDVVMSNSRGPDTLQDLVSALGPRASAASATDAAVAGDIVVVSIPFKHYRDVPVAETAGKTVIDTNNYYAERDGEIAEIADGSTTSSELLAAHLPDAMVVKAFNTIYYQDLASQGQPAGTPGRRALPLAGDDAEAKRTVTLLIREFGFDVVDAGALRDGGRFEPGTSAYNVRLDVAGLRRALADTD